MRIAVIGSGLASTAAVQELIERGVRPTIIDIGLGLDEARSQVVDRMSSRSKEEWDNIDIATITENPTVNDGSDIPKKLVFGSDYIYGTAKDESPLKHNGIVPPFSFAKGGFSAGWGAAVLPPDDNDISDWPVKNEELAPYFKKVLSGRPYSARDDELSLDFPILDAGKPSLRLTQGNEMLLSDLRRSGLLKKGRLVFGQSRLMVRATDGDGRKGCKYCGYCMSGCVYGAIYKASDDIDRYIANRKVDYIGNAAVQTIRQSGGVVTVSFINEEGRHELNFDRVFLGAGAVNSTRIMLESRALFNHTLRLKSRAGFVIPLLRLKGSPFEWPDVNTQPGIFLEYKAEGLSDHWIHTQLSTPNELVLKKLNLQTGQKGVTGFIKKKLAEHLVVAFCNLHSDHSSDYLLTLMKEDRDVPGVLACDKEDASYNRFSIRKAAMKLFGISIRIGCIAVLTSIRNNSGSYHVGCTMPMRSSPEKAMETDSMGCLRGWDRIHIIDSSVFPSLPGTSIGLLAMANAMRIASHAEL